MYHTPAVAQTVQETDDRRSAFRYVQALCLLSAVVHVLAALVAIYTWRVGDLGEFSPVKLMRFVPDNVMLWRASCLLTSASALSFVVVLAAIRETLPRKLRFAALIALMFAIIGAANDLQSHFSMMVLFSDLASQMQLSAVKQDLMQLAWMVISQSLSQTFLIANILYCLAGIVISVTMVMAPDYPDWVSWLGVPVFALGLATSVLAFMGSLNLAISFMFGSTILYVVWVVVLGAVVDPLTHLPENDFD